MTRLKPWRGRGRQRETPSLASRPHRPEPWVRPKDNWDRMEQAGHFLGNVLVPVVLLLLAHMGSRFLQQREENQSRVRMYTSIMASREQADSALRQKMFNTALSAFAEQPTENPAEQVLMLELLAHNFHNALDLEPLFSDVYATLEQPTAADSSVSMDKARHEARLARLTRTVKRKQIASLTAEGFSKSFTVDLRSLEVLSGSGGADGSAAEAEAWWTLPDAPFPRSFDLVVYEFVEPGRFEIELMVTRKGETAGDEVELIDVFWISQFELPAIRNVRLKGGQRCAVVVRELGESSAQLELLYFPASRASLKDKPYYDEIVEKYLLKQ